VAGFPGSQSQGKQSFPLIILALYIRLGTSKARVISQSTHEEEQSLFQVEMAILLGLLKEPTLTSSNMSTFSGK
jgi:hypothetical protein